MIADLNVHWDIGQDGQPKPHAHVMSTTRSVDEAAFGELPRRNRCRCCWGAGGEAGRPTSTEGLAELGVEVRIDHRLTSKTKGICRSHSTRSAGGTRTPGRNGLEADRLEKHREIARENGDGSSRIPPSRWT